MKIIDVRTDNRKKAFEIHTGNDEYLFPFAKLKTKPSQNDRVREVFPDEEAGREAFTYRLESGVEDSVHLDAVLEYNRDPAYLNELLLHRLTVEVREAVEASDLSKREMIRCLGTSPSQFYRLLDPTYYGKSVGQMAALLRLLGYEADIQIRPLEEPSGVESEKP